MMSGIDDGSIWLSDAGIEALLQRVRLAAVMDAAEQMVAAVDAFRSRHGDEALLAILAPIVRDLEEACAGTMEERSDRDAKARPRPRSRA